MNFIKGIDILNLGIKGFYGSALWSLKILKSEIRVKGLFIKFHFYFSCKQNPTQTFCRTLKKTHLVALHLTIFDQAFLKVFNCVLVD